MRNRLGSAKGFTLVEVIVVAVIVLVLAAAAIPIYTNYVADSRKASAENLAGAVASSLGTVKSQWAANSVVSINHNKVDAASYTFTIPAGGIGSSLAIMIPNGFSVSADGTRVVVSHRAGGSSAFMDY